MPPSPPSVARARVLAAVAASVLAVGATSSSSSSVTAAGGAFGFDLRILPQPEADAKGAKCLDGSPPGYYYRKGVGADASRWRIHFRGGAWCYTDEDCYYRRSTILGSSTGWPADIGTNGTLDTPFGFMNVSEPHFGNWTTVFVPYCDGSSYTSYRADPAIYNGTKVWYRGRTNLDALLDDMESLAGLLTKSEALVLTGTSAGGLTTYIHAPHVRQRLHAGAAMHALPDAGFFLDHPTAAGQSTFRQEMQTGLATWNATGGLDQDCVAHYRSQAGGKDDLVWKCLFAQYFLPIVAHKVPYFVINSLYDLASLRLILMLNCTPTVNTPGDCSPQQMQWFQEYRDASLTAIQNAAPSSAGIGVFTSACYQHEETCVDNDWDGIVVRGTTPSELFYKWYTGQAAGEGAQVYDGRWPSNPSCFVGRHGAC